MGGGEPNSYGGMIPPTWPMHALTGLGSWTLTPAD